MTFTDDRGTVISAREGNILKWRGQRRGPAFPGCTNAEAAAHVFLTLVDGSKHTLRDAEAERFLDWAEVIA